MRGRALERERAPERVTDNRERGRRIAQRYEGIQLESRNRPMEYYGGFEKRIYNQAIPFFFTNFPEDWSFEEMWGTFNRLGEGRVIEIDRPKKRHCLGRRFGFVRFLEVRDDRELERKLNQGNGMNGTTKGVATSEAETHPKLSYAEVVKGRMAENQDRGQETKQYHGTSNREQINKARTSEQRTWRWKPKQQHQEWSGMEFNEKFFMEGIFFCKIKAMGGRLVLMEGHETGDLKELVENYKEWLGQWFEEIKPWTPTMVATERFAWIRCLGLPLHAWKTKYFQSFGNLWGTFISVDDSTSQKKCLDVARFLISTPIMESISNHLTIKINGVVYKIKFSKEESSNSLYIMNTDFKIKGDYKSEEEWPTEDLESEAGHGFQYFDSEHTRGEEEDDDMATELRVPETGVEDGVRALEASNHSLDDTSTAEWVSQHIRSNNNNKKKKKSTVERTEDEAFVTEGMGDVRGMGTDSEDNKENKGSRGTFKLGATVEASGENNIECSTKSSTMEQMGVPNGPLNKKNASKPSHVRSEEVNSFWKDLDSNSEGCGLRGTRLQKKKKGKRLVTEKMEQEVAFEANSTDLIANDSIDDSNIQNCNKSIELENRSRGTEALWRRIKELGVSTEGNEILVGPRRGGEEEGGSGIGDEAQNNMEWVAKSSSRAFGGLIIIWNSEIFKKVDVFEGDGFLGIYGLWGPDAHSCILCKVYSPCDLEKKKILWESLQQIIKNNRGCWCIGGDFNAIRCLQKRKGGRSARREIMGFEEFILNSGLMDLPLLGRKYTWYQPNGQCMSRLDRFLFNDEWLTKWLDLKQWGLHRSLSDHSPILVKNEAHNWGPKPFKFFNAWLHNPRFTEMVAAKWRETSVQGWGGFILKEKLKMTKEFLRVWSKSSLQEVDRKIEESKEEMNRIDEKAETCSLTKEDLFLRSSHYTKLLKNINEINVISIGGKELRQVGDIKQGVMKYFENLFTDEGWTRPKLEGLKFRTISEADRCMLIEPFTEEEVKTVVWNCDSTKALGPDGFTFGFIKNEWEVIKVDIMEFLKDFHNNRKLVRGSNASFLVLIPKTENPQGENQFAFIEGRQLVDGVVVANEAIDGARKRKSWCFIFKIDFEKAYDKVCWSFLDYMMERMGFDIVWRGWIAKCLKSNMVSVLVNGSATKEFSMTRGLRQGDPLSPFLFLMVVEALNGLTSAVVAKGYFWGVKIGDGELEVSHLQFADDTLFMGEATEDNVWTVKCIMRAFELVSRLKINYRKSSLIGVNIDEDWIRSMAWMMNYKTESLPCKYLGMPLGANPKRIST
ncbi:hypothetical protein SLEP1_g51093 [Rubroshorea leprosula]|uniref:Reverse transcriptase domain-containing protein n=1 Tax=Rubroshorea leprosula TaxID=152421 RepID=A0AAV5M2V9_9ROSI|nr:hypothetical protein SLEP1_g51093 [Rubroshorea leprosula]